VEGLGYLALGTGRGQNHGEAVTWWSGSGVLNKKKRTSVRKNISKEEHQGRQQDITMERK
jgi:hypothetical protein